MTDTKTKPHGWVVKDYRDYLNLNCSFSFHPQKPKYSGEGVEHVPLCLVSPALLDAIDEVETFLAAIPTNRQETEWRENVARHLLDKLKEVRK